MNANAIITILLMPAAVAAIIAVSLVQAKKARANLAVLGDKLGLCLDTQGRFFKKHRLIGELRGKATDIFGYTTGSGKNQQSWVAIAVRVKSPTGLTFSLKQRMSLFEFIAKRFRKNTVELGDVAFDEKWVLATNQPDFMQAALLPELRAKILRLSGGRFASGHYKCEVSTVQYAEQGSFSGEQLCTRLGEISGLVCDLADVVEVFTEVQK